MKTQPKKATKKTASEKTLFRKLKCDRYTQARSFYHDFAGLSIKICKRKDETNEKHERDGKAANNNPPSFGAYRKAPKKSG